MANATIRNATTFTVAPVMSGANITSATIPIASLASGGLLVSSSNQTVTGIKTFTQQPVTTFTTTFSDHNTRYGYLSGNATTTGINNTIFGYNAGPVLTSSGNNVLVGRNAGALMSTGNGQNVFVGSSAGAAITTGEGNVAVGFEAAKAITGNSYNVLIGSQVTNGVSTAIGYSVFVGATARGTGYIALGATATGSSASFSLGFAANGGLNEIKLGTTTEYIQCPGTSANGALKASSFMSINIPLTTVNGSVSGNLRWSQPNCGSAYKKVVIFCGHSAALNGTASFTFTVPFIKTPAIIINSGAGGPSASVVTALSTTGVTITGSSTTGAIFLEGY